MNQADTIYEQELREREVLDDEKLPTKVVRIWINDHMFEENEVLTIVNSNCSKKYTVDVSELIFHVKVITEKGNIFNNEYGSLEYQFASSTWITPSLGIVVNVINEKGMYKIILREWSNGNVVGNYTSQGVEFEDITQTFMVDLPIEYKVEVWKKVSGWTELPASPKKVPKKVQHWNNGPIKYVFINGMSI
jgi:hypothetical protein